MHPIKRRLFWYSWSLFSKNFRGEQ